MHFAQHLMISWFLGEDSGLKDIRERRVVTFAGLLPDIDIVFYIAGFVYSGFNIRTGYEWHKAYHHRFTHGLGFVLLTGIAAFLICKFYLKLPSLARSLGIAFLSLVASVLHVLCDAIASGPMWPTYPLWPLDGYAWYVEWSWTLADWPNILCVLVLLYHARGYGILAGRTAVEAFSPRLDAWLVWVLRGAEPEEKPSAPANA